MQAKNLCQIVIIYRGQYQKHATQLRNVVQLEINNTILNMQNKYYQVLGTKRLVSNHVTQFRNGMHLVTQYQTCKVSIRCKVPRYFSLHTLPGIVLNKDEKGTSFKSTQINTKLY